MCASNHFQVGAFIRSAPNVEFPDIQHHFFPGAVEIQKDITQYHAYQIHVGTMRPASRGFIKLKTKNFFDYPIIDPCLLSEEKDLHDLCESVKLTIEVHNSKSLQKYSQGPINYEEDLATNHKKLESWVKQHLESAYHCSGTCAMGKVTDYQGRVIGIDNLRICDASLMPYVVSGNTNAPTIMMAEKIADYIKGVQLPKADVKFFTTNNLKD